MNGFPLSPKISTKFLIFSHPGKLAPLSSSPCPSLFWLRDPGPTPPWNLQQPLYPPKIQKGWAKVGFFLLRTPPETKTYKIPPKKWMIYFPSSVEVQLLFPRGGFPLIFRLSRTFREICFSPGPCCRPRFFLGFFIWFLRVGTVTITAKFQKPDSF